MGTYTSPFMTLCKVGFVIGQYGQQFKRPTNIMQRPLIPNFTKMLFYNIYKKVYLWSFVKWALLWINMAENQIAQQLSVSLPY
jgi:hypothetical protein